MNKRKDTTAEGIAKQRLIETLAHPNKRVINDPYAARFVKGAGLIKLIGHKLNVWLGQKLAPGFHEHLISRTRFVDDLIEKSISAGVEQYVILGAGYDMRAHRLKLSPALKIFEVDQLEVQDKKRSKLPKELLNSENITYVNVDFTHQSLAKQLLDAGFDQNKSTIFTLEGVSQYITKEALGSTLEEMAKLTQKVSSFFFISYVDERLNDNPEACFGKGYPKAAKRYALIKDLTAKVAEPWISFYDCEEIKNLLSQNGYAIKEDVVLSDLNSQYFAPVGRALPEDQLFNLERFVIAESNNLPL